MGLFKRKNKDEQPRTCPECCQIVSAAATECDMCGAQLAPAALIAEPAGIER
jgi:methionyl-tRNA synthetase